MSRFGPLFIIFAAFLWSLDAVFRTQLYSLSPIVVVFWEHLFGAVLLLPFMAKRFALILKLTTKQWIAAVLIALFASTLGTIFYTSALGSVQYVPLSIVVLLQQLQPIFAITLAAVLLKEKLSKKFVFLAILALVSAYFLSFPNLQVNLNTGDKTLMAAVFALLAAISWGAGTALGRYLLKELDFVTTTFLRFSQATVYSLVLIFVFGVQGTLLSLSAIQWQSLAFIVVLTGMGAMLIYYFGLKHTQAKVATICEMTWPLSALLIDIIFNKTQFSITQILGIIGLLLSIALVTRENFLHSKQIEEPLLSQMES